MDLLGDELLAVHSDVLEEDVRDQSVLALRSKEVNLGGLVQALKLWLALDVELVEVLFIGLEEEVLSLLAHDLDLASNSLVHLLLSLDSLFSIKLLRDLSNF